jgi:hypothetical protein
MNYFSHFSSLILTFICLFDTIQISRIIAIVSRWSIVESCGPWFWNIGGHVAWRPEMITSPTFIRKFKDCFMEGLKTLHRNTKKIPLPMSLSFFIFGKCCLFEIYHWSKFCQIIWYIPFVIGFLTLSSLHKYLVESIGGIHDLLFHWPFFLSNFNR